MFTCPVAATTARCLTKPNCIFENFLLAIGPRDIVNELFLVFLKSNCTFGKANSENSPPRRKPVKDPLIWRQSNFFEKTLEGADLSNVAVDLRKLWPWLGNTTPNSLLSGLGDVKVLTLTEYENGRIGKDKKQIILIIKVWHNIKFKVTAFAHHY